jgi:hypothetical protein
LKNGKEEAAALRFIKIIKRLRQLYYSLISKIYD